MGRPLPEVPPVRPFHRNSTLEDVETVPLGRLIGALVVREGLRQAEREFPDPDEATRAMVRIALREGPVRALVLLSRGMVRFADVDALLAALNREWGASATAARAAVRHRLR
jgi:beta-glucosidase